MAAFYEVQPDGSEILLTVEGEMRGDRTLDPIVGFDTPDDDGGGDPPTPGGATTVFGISPHDSVGFSTMVATLGRPVLLRRYQKFNIPPATSSERVTAYWWEGNVGDTDAQIDARLDEIPAGYLCLGHENDHDADFAKATIRLIDRIRVRRPDGKVKAAMIGRGFTLRQEGWRAYRDRVFPVATDVNGVTRNVRTEMKRTFATTGQQVAVVCVDLYDGKNASNGTATVNATNGTKFPAWELFEEIINLSIDLDLRWGIGEWAQMLSKYLPGNTDGPGPGVDSPASDPDLPLGFRLGNRSDRQHADSFKEYFEFLADPANYYNNTRFPGQPEHKFPGARPPEVFCYWLSFNGYVFSKHRDPFSKANNYILDSTKWPLATAQMKKGLKTSAVPSLWTA